MAVKVEGVTTFHLPPWTSFRYKLQLKNNKLSIWMEDRISKKQWCKNDMATDDYMTPANTIIDASALNYFKYFQEVLDCKLDNGGDVQRTVSVSFKTCILYLSFAVRFRFLSATKVAYYTFTLDPVPLERIDVLESKLRDQQEELEQLRADRALQFARFKASTKDATTRKLLWNTVESDSFYVANGEIKILRPGVYSVGVVVNNTARVSNDNASLLKNYEWVQKAACPFVNRASSATLCSILQLKEGDTVSVQCDGDVGSTCYLTIAQIGC
ncbi:hypothetical protein DVH05_004954 [Phytophthora capsici]|nr:hypothetical protein DVH05_004954 [Phytophthora capsici]|eukprot:jgi/Phyca11/103242/e_gw1.7.601.1